MLLMFEEIYLHSGELKSRLNEKFNNKFVFNTTAFFGIELFTYEKSEFSTRRLMIFLFICSKWSKDTHDFFLKLWQSGDASEAGVCLLPVVELTTESGGVQAPWRHLVFGCTDLDAKTVEQYSKEHRRDYK